MGESNATVTAYKVLLPKVHGPVVPHHVSLCGEHPATGRIKTRKATLHNTRLVMNLLDDGGIDGSRVAAAHLRTIRLFKETKQIKSNQS